MLKIITTIIFHAHENFNGFAEPRPYGHNSDILVGAGLCPARLKGKTLRLLPAAKSTAPVRGGKQVIGNP